MKIIFAFFVILLSACTGLPKGIDPVSGFELESYLGKWYEIARLDHRYERGLDNVSAEYSLRSDNGVEVKNRGFSQKSQEWEEAIGKAYFKADTGTAHLKVSFFGPVYGSYVVFKLDKPDYQYAFVTSYNRKSLWFLSRTPQVSNELYNTFLQDVTRLGFDTSGIIRVDQSRQ